MTHYLVYIISVVFAQEGPDWSLSVALLEVLLPTKKKKE